MKTSPRDRCAGKARRTSRCGGTATAQGGSITFHAKLAARSSNSSTDVIAATVARHELEGKLSDLGNYVNIVAGGDPVIVDASGFPPTAPRASPTCPRPPRPRICACARAI